MDFSMKRKELYLILSSAAVGILSTAFCDRWPSLLGLWSLMPLLWLETESRRGAFLVPLVYYLSISRGILPGAYVFFQDGSLVRACALWTLSAAALAAPWALLWGAKSPVKKICYVVLAVLISIPPPLGLIGWGNPLTAAGLFFPSFGWFGLILMLDLYVEAAQSAKLRRALIVIALLIVPCLSLPRFPERVTVDGVTIQGIDTHFGRMASGSGDFDAQYERERSIFQYVNERKRDGDLEGTDVIVLPETVIGRTNSTTMKRWEKFFAPFARKGMSFVAGGEIPRGMKYDNVMVSFEGESIRQMAKQRFPVPFSMFRPFSGEGANAYLSSLGEVSVMEIHGKKLGFLICYEQFLTCPFLTLMSQKPDVIVAPANLWWCRDTSLPGIQAATIRLLARLFGVSAVASVNR